MAHQVHWAGNVAEVPFNYLSDSPHSAVSTSEETDSSRVIHPGPAQRFKLFVESSKTERSERGVCTGLGLELSN